MEHLYWLFQLWCICAACGMVLRAGYVCSSSLYRAHLVSLLASTGPPLQWWNGIKKLFLGGATL